MPSKEPSSGRRSDIGPLGPPAPLGCPPSHYPLCRQPPPELSAIGFWRYCPSQRLDARTRGDEEDSTKTAGAEPEMTDDTNVPVFFFCRDPGCASECSFERLTEAICRVARYPPDEHKRREKNCRRSLENVQMCLK